MPKKRQVDFNTFLDRKVLLATAKLDLQTTIRWFSKAMQTANLEYVAKTGRQTRRMQDAWENYVVICRRIMELGN